MLAEGGGARTVTCKKGNQSLCTAICDGRQAHHKEKQS